MSDFRAKITSFADLSNATSQINSFVNQQRQVNIGVNLNLTNAGQNLANILSQLQSQSGSAGSTAGARFAAGFNGSLGQINTAMATGALNNFRTALTRDFKFDSSVADNITKDLDNIGISINSVQSKLNADGGLNVSVKGVDQMGRAVTVAKNFDNTGQHLGTTLNTVATAEKMVSANQIQITKNNLTAWANKNSKAVEAFGGDIKNLQDNMQRMIDNGGATSSDFKAVTDNIKLMQSNAKASGKIGKTFSESFGNAFSSMLKFAASYVSIRRIFYELRNGVKTVVALDDALVDLQKTSNATPQQLNSFYREANDIAKQYGTTTQQIIQGAAD